MIYLGLNTSLCYVKATKSVNKMPAAGSQGQMHPAQDSKGDGCGRRPTVAPTGAADECWICLETEHESGAPLRRDCSCRNHSGHVHFPCLVRYAEEFCQRDCVDSWREFVEPWDKCPHCKQQYMNELDYDLATVLVDFVERGGGGEFYVTMKWIV